MSGNDRNTGTQTQSSTLPAGTMNALNTSSTGAQNLYDSGNLFRPYTGSTVVGYDPATTRAQSMTYNAVDTGAPQLRNSFGNIAGISNSGGLNDTQNSAIGQIQGIANGANGSYSESNLARYADGSQIGASNPAFEQVLRRTQTDAQDAVNRGASAAGRYGSGIAQGNVAREVGGVTASALSNQYNQDVANQFNANSLLDAQRMGNKNLQLSAVGDLFNAGQQGQQNTFTAAGMLPTLFDSTLDPARAVAGIGAQNEDYMTRMKNDELRIWQEQQDQQRKSLEWLNAIATGSGNLGGSQTTTASAPGTNPFLAGAGGAISGFGSTGSLGGALLGGGAGLLGSLF